MTDTTNTRPRVPQMRLQVEGQTYGGAYWNAAVFEVTLDAPADGSLDGDIELKLLTSSGHDADTRTLTAAQASAIYVLMNETLDENLVPGVEGLVRTNRWVLGDDMRDHVELRDTQLDEIANWLHYALGHDDWDYTDGDEWEH